MMQRSTPNFNFHRINSDLDSKIQALLKRKPEEMEDFMEIISINPVPVRKEIIRQLLFFASSYEVMHSLFLGNINTYKN
ncbi:MAG: hypothetical protein ACOC3T_01935 [Bacteroidota bacterium]